MAIKVSPSLLHLGLEQVLNPPPFEAVVRQLKQKKKPKPGPRPSGLNGTPQSGSYTRCDATPYKSIRLRVLLCTTQKALLCQACMGLNPIEPTDFSRSMRVFNEHNQLFDEPPYLRVVSWGLHIMIPYP